MAPTAVPYSEPHIKLPGYTGFTPGLRGTYARTPAVAQVETRDAALSATTLSATTRTLTTTSSGDSAARARAAAMRAPVVLWPQLQARTAQESCKPPASHIVLGDDGAGSALLGGGGGHATSYGAEFAAPSAAAARLRSPMRNADLAAGAATSLREHCASSYNRVGEKRLDKMIVTMRERLSAKLGNDNANAFRLRRLFKHYDAEGSGLIHFEDFRMFGESFGMQLDDDSLLALYHRYDRARTGRLAYGELMAVLLDADAYALYADGVDNTQALADARGAAALARALRARLSAPLGDALRVLSAYDAAGAGALAPRDFDAACAALGIVLSAKEAEWARAVAAAPGGRGIDYEAFVAALDKAEGEGEAAAEV